ncbi:AbrB family transcriptional regulator [Mangrovicoccus algicola]|uniref:AbrB family transcriptional regulator n=1 Tax=Mangrovicoccus algicola TaxID=2771008 RepID=A0A8J7CHY1_9RHOB|nr:AbrB family transcriptional regulator [Mangrovicoccus algicola]MBE3638865.1 AbrB family transcriptional regulator [Mangrovicoccus algicola]
MPNRTDPAIGRPAAWALLGVLSVAAAAALELVRLPAALLLGPMAAAIFVAAARPAPAGRPLSLPRAAFEIAQAAVGVSVGSQLPASVLDTLRADWAVFGLGVVSVIAASSWLGYLLARRQVLPGTTAVWGASPGAAQAMVFLAGAHGADMRLVAVMQYLRVGMVAGGASLVAMLAHAGGDAPAPPPWFPPPDAGLAAACAVMAAAILAARLTRMAAGSFLLALLFGAVAANAGPVAPAMPHWLMALAYGAAGWAVGLRFTRAILAHAARALPRLALSVLLLMGLCGLMAAALVAFAGVDPLTAYLATSPGGADTVAIIAASSNVDLPFVMAMQTLRFVMVLLSGPWIARQVARRLPGAPQAPG